ncbi:hypothetical protein D918_04057 [Trichuris suis]|nr:hypothetical protein D918_04057 [Trichuris suis]
MHPSQSGGVLLGSQRPPSAETAGTFGTGAPSPVQSNAPVAPSAVVGGPLLTATKIRPEVSTSTFHGGVSKSEHDTSSVQKGGYPLAEAPSTNSSSAGRPIGSVAVSHTQMIDGCIRQPSIPLLLNQYSNARDPNAMGYKTFTGSSGANRPTHYQTTSAPFNPLAAYQPTAIPPGLPPYMGLYDQMNLNSLGYFPAPNLVFNNAFDINSLSQLPPSMAASSLASGREMGGEYKTPMGRIDSNNLTGMSNVSLAAVPTAAQGPAHAAAFAGSTGTSNAAAQQAAALMGLGPFPPFSVMTQLQHPYAFPPFVMPSMANTAASTVATSVAPKPGLSPFSQAMYNPAVYDDLLGASDCSRGYGGYAGAKSTAVGGIVHQHQTVAGVQHPGDAGQKGFGGNKPFPPFCPEFFWMSVGPRKNSKMLFLRKAAARRLLKNCLYLRMEVNFCLLRRRQSVVLYVDVFFAVHFLPVDYCSIFFLAFFFLFHTAGKRISEEWVGPYVRENGYKLMMEEWY